jgi:hypothetical protein
VDAERHADSHGDADGHVDANAATLRANLDAGADRDPLDHTHDLRDGNADAADTNQHTRGGEMRPRDLGERAGLAIVRP